MRETDRPIRVVHVITGLNTGGAEVFLCRLLESLGPPLFRHTVVCLIGEGPLSGRAALVAELHHLGMRRSHFRLSDLSRLRRILRDCKPDLVHAWMYHANLMAALATLRTRVPLIWGVRQSLYDLHRERRNTQLVIRLSRVMSSRPKRIIYNSLVGRQQHEAFGFNRTFGMVIPNGFDVEMLRPDPAARMRVRAELEIEPDYLVVGLVARWHPMKDHDNFLHAAELFIRTHPRTVFLLVGEGLDKRNKTLIHLVGELGLTKQVRLCGRRSDIPAINAALDIASSSSSWGEGFPNAIGEAMACGVPCVATDVGGVGEIIGDTGVVVPQRNRFALCDGLESLARLGASGRADLGLRARQRIIGTYELSCVAQQYAELYDALA